MMRLVELLLRILLRPVFVLMSVDSALSRWLCRQYLRVANAPTAWMVVSRGDTVIQVGTPNVVTVGRYARAVGKNGRVVILEIDEENAARLQAYTHDRDLRNTVVVNKGAWSTSGVQQFFHSANTADHKIPVKGVVMDNDLNTANKSYQPVTAEVCTLDELVSDMSLPDIGYLCITVNGAELEVLKGARKVLSKCDTVFAKGHARLVGGGTLGLKIAEYLQENKFQVTFTRGEKSVSGQRHWRRRSGDIFASRVTG